NGEQIMGAGWCDVTIAGGKRQSAAVAFLHPVLDRENLTALTAAPANRLLFEGTRCVGVEYEHDGEVVTANASTEVVVSGGTIGSAQLLMLSGIGDAEHLKGHDITAISHLPGVGQNLQDHLELYIQQASIQPITLYKHWNLWGKAAIGAQWLFTKTGLGASNQFESAAFLRSGPEAEYPDIQYHFLPIAVRYDGQAASEGHGFQAHVGPMRSKSRGQITLQDADPDSPPKIEFNYMSHPEDWVDFRRCIRLTRKIFAQEAFDPYRGDEIQPGAAYQTDDELHAFITEHAESAYHPCGTCRMGAADDPMAVVDPDCRVIGVDALRVADSSIFPRVTNGNLNAPSIMTGEKAADHVLGQGMLPRADL
ncbi:MAG: GMC oxidoreductase, partial [Pseudomonadota bacterium]